MSALTIGIVGVVAAVYIAVVIRLYILDKRDDAYRRALKFTHDEWRRAQILTKRFEKMKRDMLWKK